MKKLWTAIRESFKAIRSGEFLLRIRADKYYLHIMYLFLLMWVSILLGLRVDRTLAEAGSNKAELEELRIRHTQKEAELVKLQSASETQKRLEKLGSKVAMPKEPATILKKK